MNQLPALRAFKALDLTTPGQTRLGTAEWRPDILLPQYQIGAIWLGRTADGASVGVRDDRHVLVCSGSRSGKGTSFIVPNLCLWAGSAVIVDPKGENAIVTARRRAGGSAYCNGLGQKVYILDPFGVVRTPEDDFQDLRGSFNPLDVLRTDDPESVEASFRLADAMVTGERSNDPFFDDSAKDFISYVQLHVATAPEYPNFKRNLVTVRELIVAGEPDYAGMFGLRQPGQPAPSGHARLFASMQKNPAFDGIIARAGASYADLEATSPRLFGSIVQVAKTNTRFIEGQAMQRVLQSSSFALSDLKTAAKGITVFLSLPERASESHFRWLRMMVSLIATEMERVPRKPACGHPVLMLLDEFPALKRMRTIENAVAQIAGHGVKLVFIVQSLGQLKDHYKDNWETFVANSGIKFFSCNDDHFTREYASKLIGDTEVVRRLETMSQTIGVSESRTVGSSTTVSSGSSYSTGGSQGSLGWNSGTSSTSSFSRTYGQNASETRGYSTSIHKRALVSPDEVGRLFGRRDDPRALVLFSGHQPARLTRTFYYSEEFLSGTYGWHPDHPKPLTLPALTRRRTEAKRAADLKATYERWAKEEREAAIRLGREIHRQKALAYQRKLKLRDNVLYTVCGSIMFAAALRYAMTWFGF
jgi:type IV secretory pathway TraG/TraD family ATPase VirD4